MDGWSWSQSVLSPKAHRMLGELLQSSGELLPVLVGDDTYYIFNCFIVGEADEDKTVHEIVDGVEFGLKRIEFKDSTDEYVAFRSTLDGCITLFCSDRFKSAVGSIELSGVVFDTNLIERFT